MLRSALTGAATGAGYTAGSLAGGEIGKRVAGQTAESDDFHSQAEYIRDNLAEGASISDLIPDGNVPKPPMGEAVGGLAGGTAGALAAYMLTRRRKKKKVDDATEKVANAGLVGSIAHGLLGPYVPPATDAEMWGETDPNSPNYNAGESSVAGKASIRGGSIKDQILAKLGPAKGTLAGAAAGGAIGAGAGAISKKRGGKGGPVKTGIKGAITGATIGAASDLGDVAGKAIAGKYDKDQTIGGHIGRGVGAAGAAGLIGYLALRKRRQKQQKEAVDFNIGHTIPAYATALGGLVGSTRVLDPGESRAQAILRSALTGAATGYGGEVGETIGANLGHDTNAPKGGWFNIPGKSSQYRDTIMGGLTGRALGMLAAYQLAKRKGKQGIAPEHDPGYVVS
jgi:hypothetical protein